MPFAKVNPCIRELMKKASEDVYLDEYGWLHQEHKDKFIKRCREAEELVGDVKTDLPLDDPGQTLAELALAEPLKYTTRKGEEVTVYLVGTDHDTRDTAQQIREVAEKVKPDYICAEHPRDWKQEFTDSMTALWVKFDGDVKAMAANCDDKEFLTKMRIIGHMFRNDKYTDQIVDWGTFLSVDVGMCGLMAHNFKCPLQWIDIPEYAHDKKFGPVWDHVAMHVCLKNLRHRLPRGGPQNRADLPAGRGRPPPACAHHAGGPGDRGYDRSGHPHPRDPHARPLHAVEDPADL